MQELRRLTRTRAALCPVTCRPSARHNRPTPRTLVVGATRLGRARSCPAPGPHSNRQLTGPISLKDPLRHGHTCRYKSLGSAKIAAPANRARTPRQHTRQRHTIYTLTSYTTRRVIIGMDSPAQARTTHHAARPVLMTRPTPGSTLPPRPQFKPCSQGTRRSQGRRASLVL